jgi:glutamyl-tRNA synthetase
MSPSQVRVRIAPSPTGDPHVGTAYVTLFNYCFAKKHGGKLILRIEDTDQARYRSQSEAMIMDSLRWLGLEWDEGPDRPGVHGPYRQSERRELHRYWAEHLVQTGHAYRCFCSAERLEAMRASQKEKGAKLGYDRHCRELSAQEVHHNLKAQIPFVIRLKMPIEGTTTVADYLRGEVTIENAQMDDQILLKSDGFPTYHLANVVDDHLMEITHVIRAEEWISSTPKHVILYRAFGWKEPVFCHLPLLRNNDKSKISKRKNPTSLNFYRRAGILPKAMVNFLGLMGWSYSSDQEVFTLGQMIEAFDLKQIHLGGPIFDQQKLQWLNNQYLQKLNDDEFVGYLHNELFNTEFIKKLRPLAVERLDRFDQFVDKFSFFFNGALTYRESFVPEGKTLPETQEMLLGLAESFDEVDQWNLDSVKKNLDDYKTKIGWKPKDFFMTIRLVVTGRRDSPPLVESLTLIGSDMVKYRLRQAGKGE